MADINPKWQSQPYWICSNLIEVGRPNKLLYSIACNVSTMNFAFHQSIIGVFLENDKMTEINYSSVPTMSFVFKYVKKLDLSQLAVTLPKSKINAVSHFVFVEQPIDPIHEFCSKMDFLTQLVF